MICAIADQYLLQYNPQHLANTKEQYYQQVLPIGDSESSACWPVPPAFSVTSPLLNLEMEAVFKGGLTCLRDLRCPQDRPAPEVAAIFYEKQKWNWIEIWAADVKTLMPTEDCKIIIISLLHQFFVFEVDM